MGPRGIAPELVILFVRTVGSADAFRSCPVFIFNFQPISSNVFPNNIFAGRDIYVFGGTDWERRHQDLYKFNSGDMTSVPLTASMRKAFHRTFFGWVNNNCISTETLEWCKVDVFGVLPPRRSGALGVVFEGRMFIFGGFNGKGKSYFNDLWSFDFGQ